MRAIFLRLGVPLAKASASLVAWCNVAFGGMGGSNGSTLDSQSLYDPFTMSAANQNVPATQYNPYLEDNNSLTGPSNTYYATQPTYTAAAQPVSGKRLLHNREH